MKDLNWPDFAWFSRYCTSTYLNVLLEQVSMFTIVAAVVVVVVVVVVVAAAVAVAVAVVVVVVAVQKPSYSKRTNMYIVSIYFIGAISVQWRRGCFCPDGILPFPDFEAPLAP